jgi:hypothetical protein
MPYARKYEESVSRWLLPVSERGKYFLRFNYDVLLRPDAKTRAEFESLMVNNGLMTRNEVRAKENLNHSEQKGMDDFTVQTALAPIDKLGEAKPAPMPAKPAPANVTNILNVTPERETHLHAGDTHVAAPRVLAPITIQPAAVTNEVRAGDVHVAPAEVRGGDVNIENGSEVAAMAKSVSEMAGSVAQLVEGMRRSQEENRALAAKLLEQK